MITLKEHLDRNPALVLSRANNEEKINEVSKEPGELQYYSMPGKQRRAYEREQQAKPVIQQASQNLRAGKDDFTKGLEGERAAKEIQIRKIANVDPIKYEDFMPWEQREPRLVRTVKNILGFGDDDEVSSTDKAFRSAIMFGTLFALKKTWDNRGHGLGPYSNLNPNIQPITEKGAKKGGPLSLMPPKNIPGPANIARPIEYKEPTQVALENNATRIAKISQEPPPANEWHETTITEN